MDSGITYSELVKQTLHTYAEYYSQEGCEWPLRTLFDDRRHGYLLLDIGWRGDEYIHNATVHIDIIDEKIWIQHDDTEDGVATDLLDAGVPKEDIVLGFRPPELRKYTGFATIESP